MKNVTTQLKKYWVIINYKKNSIWKGIFHTREEAQFEFQTLGESWKIEDREYYRKVEDEGFDDF